MGHYVPQPESDEVHSTHFHPSGHTSLVSPGPRPACRLGAAATTMPRAVATRPGEEARNEGGRFLSAEEHGTQKNGAVPGVLAKYQQHPPNTKSIEKSKGPKEPPLQPDKTPSRNFGCFKCQRLLISFRNRSKAPTPNVQLYRREKQGLGSGDLFLCVVKRFQAFAFAKRRK